MTDTFATLAQANIPVEQVFLMIFLLLSLGALAGFLAGLLGVGGGLVLVPGLFYIFTSLHDNIGFDTANLMHLCVGTSLAIIIPTGFSSAMAHRRRGAVDMSIVRTLGIGVVIGVAGATMLAKGLDALTMKMIFASVILFLAGVMLADPARFQLRDTLPPQPYTSIAGVVIGAISTLVGIGGATLTVPYLSLHGTKIHRAVGSSSALGLVISIPAALGYVIIGWDKPNLPPLSFGYVNILAWGCIIPVSILFAPLGARVAHKVNAKRLKKTFAFFMVLVALDMWRKILFV